MTVAATQMTLADYLAYDDGTDTAYELEQGILVFMPPESERNRRLALFLLAYFLQGGVPLHHLTVTTEIAVSGRRVSVRRPDLMVLSADLSAALQGATRSTVLMEMPPPLLVVEVVSPGKVNEDRDYRYKRSEYAARGIGEYWIVDPQRQRVTVLTWVEGLYEEAMFEGDTEIASRLLKTLTTEATLTVAQLWQAAASSSEDVMD